MSANQIFVVIMIIFITILVGFGIFQYFNRNNVPTKKQEITNISQSTEQEIAKISQTKEQEITKICQKYGHDFGAREYGKIYYSCMGFTTGGKDGWSRICKLCGYKEYKEEDNDYDSVLTLDRIETIRHIAKQEAEKVYNEKYLMENKGK